MIFLIFLVVLGVIFQAPAMVKSGLMHDYGIGYWGPLGRDGVWHEALVNQLKFALPPQNPGFAGQILTNYHYFYDILVAKISQLTLISVPFLIYQFFPIVFSVLLGIGTYLLSQRLFKDKSVSLIAVFFAFFGSSFGWIISLLKHQPIGGESSFWANQPVSMNLNPPYAISLVILIFGIILLDTYLKNPKILSGLLLTIVFGTLIGFKAYAGAIGIVALFALTLKKIVFEKSFSLLLVFGGAALLFAGIYFAISRGAGGLIGIQPFWLIDTMIDAGDRVGIPNFTAKRFAYLGGHKYFQLLILESIGFIIFFVGNLGTRIVGLWGIKKQYFKNDLHLFVMLLMAASFFPVLIFVQKGNPWNIVQFFYYFMFFAGLYAANALKNFSKPLIILIILVTPISSLAAFRGWIYPNPSTYLPSSEFQALQFLKIQPPGTVLKVPFDSTIGKNFKDPLPLLAYADNSYVSAYSAHAVFIEDAQQQIILDTDYQERLAEATRFFVEKDLVWSNKFLLDNNIKYIYLPKAYQLPMAEQEYPMRKIFENSNVNIYLVNQ